MNTWVTALIDIAVRIGKWLVKRIAYWARDHVVGYMKGKIEDFKRRRANAKSARRKRWLSGRITRWTRAAQWIQMAALQHLAHEAQRVCELDDFKRLPNVARCERLVSP